jgi:hypothetical protein
MFKFREILDIKDLCAITSRQWQGASALLFKN